MKIVLYVTPGPDVHRKAEAIKRDVEEETKRLCIVKIAQDKFSAVRMKGVN